MVKIVLTGGPCSGKTTCLSKIEEELTNKGYKVIIVPEIATEVMKSGLSLAEVGLMDFQYTILQFQMEKDELYTNMAKIYEKHGQKVVLINDRGTMDSKAYMSKDEWNSLLQMFNTTETKLINAYDGVFHLKTAAHLDGVYTTENNETRMETKEQAIAIDKKTMDAWTGHQHLRVIDNSDDFNEKITCLLNGIYAMLGIPIPVEIERKFLIQKPDPEFLLQHFNANVTNIIQTYLKSDTPCIEKRIRQRGSNGQYTYFYTEKENISKDGMSRYERERKIDKNEYLNLLMQADTRMISIRKDRYCFVYKDTYYELDIYPEWENEAILEVELTDTSQEVLIPNGLDLIKEVTDNPRYKNYNLAKKPISRIDAVKSLIYYAKDDDDADKIMKEFLPDLLTDAERAQFLIDNFEVQIIGEKRSLEEDYYPILHTIVSAKSR